MRIAVAGPSGHVGGLTAHLGTSPNTGCGVRLLFCSPWR